MYTWVRPGGGCYTKEEVLVSKSLLMKLLNSNEMKKKFSTDSLVLIKKYVRDVISNEKDTAFYNFLDVFDFELYSNSSHEGTNNAIKHMSDPVLPTESLGTSTNKLAKHDKQLFVERNEFAKNEFNKKKLWTTSWNALTTRAAEIIQNENSKIDMVQACTFVAEDSAIYIYRPNDIHRHSTCLLYTSPSPRD